MGHGAVPDKFCKFCLANTKDKRLKTSLNTTQLSCQNHVDITMHKPFPRSEKKEEQRVFPTPTSTHRNLRMRGNEV